jgi:hypothetical protein
MAAAAKFAVSVVFLVLLFALGAIAICAGGPGPAAELRKIGRWTIYQGLVSAAFAVAAVLLLRSHSWTERIGPISCHEAVCLLSRTLSYGLLCASYLALWAICQLGMVWRDRNSLARKLKEAEIRRLRTQLNPHFLYNALTAISELGYDDPKAADRVITQLSSLLRKSLDEGVRHEISLRDEIDFLDCYLGIQKALLRDRLQVSFEVDERTLKARVPSMIIQPLAENAVIHGADNSGISRLKIRTARKDDVLLIEVEDEGRGMQVRGDGMSPGIGLANIKARLGHLYGDAADLKLCNRAGGGLVVTVAIPFHEAFAYEEDTNADHR